MAAFTVVGTSVPRIEGREKVTGGALYSADVQLPGMLWVKLLRSTEAHARLRRVDPRRARELPGVHVVITGADVGGLRTGVVLQDMPVLCDERVRFVGDPIAAVAAEDPDVAEEALKLIEVDYEPLPAVFDPEQALREDAPAIHPDKKTYRGLPEQPDIANLQAISSIQKGDVQAGFAEADHVFEHTFTTGLSHQGYLEPRACTVSIEPDGTARFWSSTQTPYRLRDMLADMLGLAREQVIVEQVSVGGSFGAKGGVGPEPIAFFLAKATGRPVKYVPTQAEDYATSNPRHPARITVRTGVKQDGTIVARAATIVMDGGAYAAYKVTPNLVLPSVARSLGPYRIPHTRIECRWAYTNNVPCGISRAPGQPQVVFAGESQMDLIADALGMDPLDFRVRNIMVEGEVWPDGAKMQGVMARETLELARRASGWDTPSAPNRGRGFAMTERGIAVGACGLVLTLHADGTLTALTGIPDVGTGAHTIMRQVIAEELQVPLNAVRIVIGNSNDALEDAGIGGSKHTFSLTRSVLQVRDQVMRTLLEVAAQRLECALDDVELGQGGFQVRGHPDSRVPATEIIAGAAAMAGGTLAARTAGPSRQDRAPNSCMVAQVVEVEVDPETGQVRPLKITSVHDVGRAINPQLLQAQIDGATIQGLGQAMMEWMPGEDGRIAAAHLGDYKLPAEPDIPELVTLLVEGAPAPPPYDAKAVAELSNIPVPAALANAVARACGARAFDLPITAERVRRALRAEGGWGRPPG
jgi:CO/xanthine dehydrogenase Mo-binding subunit